MKGQHRFRDYSLLLLIIAAVLMASAGLFSGILELVRPQPALAQAPAENPDEAAKKKKAAEFNCDPIYISGITGKCAGTGDPTGFAGEDYKAGMGTHPLALELTDLPKDRFGLIDWADAIKSGAVKPKGSINPDEKDTPPIDMDVVIFSKSKFQPDVIFPHKIHTMWLTCTNCHPGIFPMNASEANKMMHMTKISAGEFCGRCHNRIAFPLSDCLRCHVKPRDVPPIDPDYEKWGIQPIPVPE